MSERLKKTPTEENGGRKRRNDVLFIGLLLFLMISVGAFYFFFRAQGDFVTVKADGVLFGTYSLSEDQTIDIQTEYGRNLLVIREGKAWVCEASCPDGICSAHRAIFREGESIVCLPNRVVITVESEGEAPDIIV